MLTVLPIASYSADAFVQLALQLAYFRIHRCSTPVYETALTRSFQHGRTETIRSFTTESYAFLRASAGWTRNVRQTRSEVSTVHADMRALMTMISYHANYLAYFLASDRPRAALASSLPSPPISSPSPFLTHSLSDDGPRD